MQCYYDEGSLTLIYTETILSTRIHYSKRITRKITKAPTPGALNAPDQAIDDRGLAWLSRVIAWGLENAGVQPVPSYTRHTPGTPDQQTNRHTIDYHLSTRTTFSNQLQTPNYRPQWQLLLKI